MRAAALALGLLLPWSAAAAPQQTGTSIQGVTTTQGDVRLPGVEVTLTDEASGRAVIAVSDSQGLFQFTGLAPGRYRLSARLDGFAEIARAGLVLSDRQTLQVDLDLPIDTRTETVDVVSTAEDAARVAASSLRIADGKLVDVAPIQGDDFTGLLPVLPGVVRGPDGRINLKGGRPTQTGLQVNQAYAGDPSTGDFGFDLPVDAVAAIELQANPFAPEFGRFSSGVAQIETVSGGDTWEATFNNPLPMPCLKICDGRTWGVRRWGPRLIVTGPVVADTLFLSQSVQYRMVKERTPGLPTGADDFELHSLDSLTRLDLRPATGHQLTGELAIFPRNIDFLHLSTLNPQEATPSFRQRGFNVMVAETATLGQAAVLESTVNLKRYDVEILGQGDDDLTLTPDGRRGNFFNRQERRTNAFQWVESLSTFRTGPSGEHLFKVGVDLLRTSYDGMSGSRPVNVVRADGTVDRRIEFGASTTQQVAATDIAVFAQDRWRITDRLRVEAGSRLDRDGVTDRFAFSPRFGFALGLLPDGRGVLRGGAGRFFERTPLIVGAFESFETQSVTEFAADGVTALGPAVTFVNRSAADLETPSGVVWNLEYDHRFAPGWFLKVNHLRRTGANEFLIHPRRDEAGAELRLASDGASTYRETEATLRYDGPDERELTVTYVGSRTEGDLNAYDTFFGNFRNPIIQPNERSLRSIDVPHRLVVLAVVPVPILGRWIFSPLVEVRSGFPYSVIDETQAFVGPRNRGGRFPTFVSVDLAISRDLEIRDRTVRIGLKAFHMFNDFLPRTVQGNIHSPAFGTFYDSVIRKFGLMFEIQP